MGMFDFMMDAGNYSSRVVGRDDFDWGFVSTARVSDGYQPYETAIKHKEYIRNRDKQTGLMCIVEAYDTPEEAKEGHKKWLKKMTSVKLPKKLTDCANAEIAQMADMLGDKTEVFIHV